MLLTPYYLFAAFAAVAASVANELHRTLSAVIAEMPDIQELFRNRKSPAVNQLEMHRLAFIIHA